jgi:hypothetical protein
MFYYLSNDIEILHFNDFGKNLVKLDIVWLPKNNVRLKLWNGDTIAF